MSTKEIQEIADHHPDPQKRLRARKELKIKGMVNAAKRNKFKKKKKEKTTGADTSAGDSKPGVPTANQPDDK